ncbi:unnamed protein product [Medioppia subpectinata]|uniref:Uncharacterized protein n=1 Tax=Medioppia subpectinata TaxID=1979941 RepID=A0A7R9L037_9ACAR|nr:unnamed protein product [Medioppia subpectinata]CAG2113129.1 unnamed protein product [Medioppia subpectinata]
MTMQTIGEILCAKIPISFQMRKYNVEPKGEAKNYRCLQVLTNIFDEKDCKYRNTGNAFHAIDSLRKPSTDSAARN